MTKSGCPDFENILDYLEQKLPLEEAQLIESHLHSCERCRRELAEIRQLLSLMREDAIIAVPVHVHQKALALFKPWFQKHSRNSQPQPSFFKRLAAQLLIDSALPEGAAGLRAGVRSSSPVNNMSGNTRQLLYSFKDGQIELDLQLRRVENETRLMLLGQIFGLNEAVERVELIFADQTLLDFGLATQADETGTFQFGPLSAGEYNMQIYGGLEILAVENFRI